MLKVRLLIFVVCLLSYFNTMATHKIYMIHGYAGQPFEFYRMKKAFDSEHFVSEIFSYPSFKQEVDSVSKDLFNKIKEENYDSISFVTHSLGTLVVRSLYQYIDTTENFPFIHRFVMIASPNKGTPIADFWNKFKFSKFLFGPNVNNLTTDKLTGACKYPVPTCEVGLIVGVKGNDKGFNHFIDGDNDGIIPASNTELGIEKDVIYIKSFHFGMALNSKVVKAAVVFLKKGCFFEQK